MMRVPSCPSGGGSGGGGGNERRCQNQSTVDRSTGMCRPVDGRGEADPREGEAKGKSGKVLGAGKSDDLIGKC